MVKMIQMAINRRMNKQKGAYPYSEILLDNKKSMKYWIMYKMDEFTNIMLRENGSHKGFHFIWFQLNETSKFGKSIEYID